MLQSLKASGWSLLSVVARTGGTLAVTKLFAVFYGPVGIALFNHFQNLLALVTTIPTNGINVGAVRFLSSEAGGPARQAQYFRAGLYLNGAAFLAAVALLFLFHENWLGVFAVGALGSAAASWLLAVGAGLSLYVLHLFLLSVLLAHRQLPLYLVSTVLFSGLAAGFSYLALVYLNLTWALVAYLGGHGLAFFFTLGAAFYQGLVPPVRFGRFDEKIYGDLGKFLVMGLGVVLTGKLVDFVVRDILIGRFGGYEAGLWQAVVRLSDSYTLVFTALVSMVYFPRMSALLQHPLALRQYVRGAVGVVLAGGAVGLGILYLFQEFFLLLLFDRAFLPAQYLLDFQLLGDFLKMPAWALLHVVTARAQVQTYLLVQVGSAGVYVGLLYWAVGQWGLEGATVAHALRNALLLLFCLFFFYKLLI